MAENNQNWKKNDQDFSLVGNVLLGIGFEEADIPAMMRSLEPVDGVELPGTVHGSVQTVYDITNPMGTKGYLGLIPSESDGHLSEVRFIQPGTGDYEGLDADFVHHRAFGSK